MAVDRKEYMRQYQRAWVAKRRSDWLDGKECARCGSNEKLELDHIDASTKKYNPAVLWSMALDNPNRVTELAKCQVLCESCHVVKTKEQNEYLVGEKHKGAKLTEEDVRKMRTLREEGMSMDKLAILFNVGKSTVKRTVQYKTWKHVV